MTCVACQAANPVGSLFCVCCSLPLAPAPMAVPAAPVPSHGASSSPGPMLPPGPAQAARGLRLVAVENLQPTGVVLTLPDTAYTGELLLGPMRHAVERSIIVNEDLMPDIVQGQLGVRAATLGAVAHAVDSVSITSVGVAV